MNLRRVVVTGLGGITSLGPDFETTWQGLLAGRNGIGPIESFDTAEFRVNFAGVVRGYEAAEIFGVKEARKLDRFTQFALTASEDCLADSKINLEAVDLDRFGCVLGTGIGGIYAIEQQQIAQLDRGPRRASPHFVPKMMPNAMSGQVSIRFGLRGTNFATSSACASGGHALAVALRTIQCSDADLVLSGGSEAAVTPLSVAAFASMKALSTRVDEPERASRPFDKDRDGFVLGEGAGILLLEERDHALARGATIYAEFRGFGSSADAFHITQPKEDGAGPRKAMELALGTSDCRPEDVDYINAHGTSTYFNDLVESQAIRQAFGAHADTLAVSSTKSMIGHLLGGSGAIEAAVTCRSIHESRVHPTRNHESPGENCDLDYVPGEARELSIRNATSNSLGFGGHNICLLFGRHDD